MIVRSLLSREDLIFFSPLFSPEVCGVSSESLVPGDILVVPPTGMTVPCDAALLSGHAIVNEAMLTGREHTRSIVVMYTWF